MFNFEVKGEEEEKTVKFFFEKDGDGDVWVCATIDDQKWNICLFNSRVGKMELCVGLEESGLPVDEIGRIKIAD